jgi:hypothetical protein
LVTAVDGRWQSGSEDSPVDDIGVCQTERRIVPDDVNHCVAEAQIYHNGDGVGGNLESGGVGLADEV